MTLKNIIVTPLLRAKGGRTKESYFLFDIYLGETRKADIPKKPKKRKCQCYECDFITTTSSYLKRHKEVKHEGIRYPCDQCDYAATQPWSLKSHMERKHKKIQVR